MLLPTPCRFLAGVVLTFALLPVARAQEPGELLLPPTPLHGGLFGLGVDIDGDTLAVSTGSGGLNGPAGYVQIFQRNGSAWTLDATLQVPGGGSGAFAPSDVGYDLDLMGDDLLVGIPDYGPNRIGAVAFFERAAGTWGPPQFFLNPDSTNNRSFGSEVAIEGNRALVSSPRENGSTGAVYSFERSSPGSPWTAGAVLRDPAGDFNDWFGSGLALDGGRAAVAGGGDVLVFEHSLGAWSLAQRIIDPLGVGYFELDMEGGLMAAGSWGSCGHSGAPCESGWGTVIRDVGGTWVAGEQLTSPFAQYRDSFFGAEVAIEQGRILLGHQGEQDIFGSYSQGGAVLYEDFGQGYEYAQRFVLPVDWPVEGAGAVLAFDGERIALGLINGWNGTTISGTVSLHRAGPRARFVCDATGCPCGNDLPSQGCANSASRPETNRSGTLRATGSTSVSSDNLSIRADHLPSAAFGLVAMGQRGPATGVPLGGGLLCLDSGQALHRFPVRQAGSAGSFSEGPGLVAFAASAFGPSGLIAPGTTWAFQAWYRDPAGPCGAGSNITSGLEVTFTP